MAPGAIYRQKAFLIKYDWQLKLKKFWFFFFRKAELKICFGGLFGANRPILVKL
jgi:hypothetical protein